MEYNIIRVDDSNDPIIITFKELYNNSLDNFNCESIRKSFTTLSEKVINQKVCLNLDGIDFMDSAFVGAIVHLYKKLKDKKTTIEINNAKQQPYSLLILLGLNNIIKISSNSV